MFAASPRPRRGAAATAGSRGLARKRTASVSSAGTTTGRSWPQRASTTYRPACLHSAMIDVDEYGERGVDRAQPWRRRRMPSSAPGLRSRPEGSPPAVASPTPAGAFRLDIERRTDEVTSPGVAGDRRADLRPVPRPRRAPPRGLRRAHRRHGWTALDAGGARPEAGLDPRPQAATSVSAVVVAQHDPDRVVVAAALEDRHRVVEPVEGDDLRRAVPASGSRRC